MPKYGDNDPLQGCSLGWELNLPEKALGLVLFAHGSGQQPAQSTKSIGRADPAPGGHGDIAVRFDDRRGRTSRSHTRHLRFDIPFLARRLVAATRWALDEATMRDVNVGYFGSSIGAAAALVAAAEVGETIRAVVSRGGRPDLAGDALERVSAPTC